MVTSFTTDEHLQVHKHFSELLAVGVWKTDSVEDDSRTAAYYIIIFFFFKFSKHFSHFSSRMTFPFAELVSR